MINIGKDFNIYHYIVNEGGWTMISYPTLNEYLDSIILPKSIEEVLEYKYELEGRELQFILSANDSLKKYADYESYRSENAHCMGTCLMNFTRVGIYFLLEKEIVTVSTSNFNEDVEKLDWKVTHYPFKKIIELDLEFAENGEKTHYETGVLYVKVIDDKDVVRTHVLHNMNPRHLHCFRDFHSNIVNNVDVPNTCKK